MAEKDLTTKTLESYNSVFADIMNVFLFDGKPVVSEESLTPAENESQYKVGGKIRKHERDVSKFWMNANIKIAFIGIENQSAPDKFMPLRVISYDGAVYQKQYRSVKKSKNASCYPVITLVIYFGKENWNYGQDIHSCLEIPDELLPFVNNYKMNFYSIKDMSKEQISKFKSDFKAIAEFFFALNNKVDYHPTDRKLDHPEEVIDMISVFSGDDRFRNEYNSMTEEKMKAGVSMCEIYDKIFASGEARGEARGREIGEARGREIGEARGREIGEARGREIGEAMGFLKALIGLVKDNILTLADAAKRANMTIDEFEKQMLLLT